VRISVRDAGVGIDPLIQERIFDMFTQGPNEIEHGRGGLGIGLTLAKNLVELHGGRIEVHSEGRGSGSEFVLYLPVALPVQPSRRPSAPPRERTEVATPRSILVVDDNPDQAESLRLLLELHGHQVEIARDGPSALDAIDRAVPDFALVDIGLPGMSGYEVARRVRERPELASVRLVAQTGWGQDSDRVRSKEAGFDFHLVKPIDIDVLEDVLSGATVPSGNGG
jgi:CheY-like chemotaxis protein